MCILNQIAVRLTCIYLKPAHPVDNHDKQQTLQCDIADLHAPLRITQPVRQSAAILDYTALHQSSWRLQPSVREGLQGSIDRQTAGNGSMLAVYASPNQFTLNDVG